MAKDEPIIIKPHEGPQTEFLQSSADIVIFGGAAGGGKTRALLMEPLRHISNPTFRGIIIRRTSTELTDEGGLVDESHILYPHVGGKLNRQSLRWSFPSGAHIRFRHLENRSYTVEWKGTQAAFLGFDQVEDTEEHEFFYILSRLRSVSGVKPYVRCTCNPDPDSWISGFIDWWIDKEGYPIPARCGKVRWFIRLPAGDLLWRDSPDKFEKEGYQDVISRSVTFIPATLEDNPTLMRVNPEYKSQLDGLPHADRMRLRFGNWRVRDDIDSEWPSDLFGDQNIIEEWPKDLQYTIQQLDPSYGKEKGDYQALITLGVRGDGLIYVGAKLVRLGLMPLADTVVADALTVPLFPILTVVEEITMADSDLGPFGNEIVRRAEKQKTRLNVTAISPYSHELEVRGTPKGLKDTRIRYSLDELVRNQRFRFINSIGMHILLDQMRQFPNGKFDDGPDCLARGVDTLSALAEEIYG